METIVKIKARDDWELDVLGIPYGGPNNGRDADGEYFDSATKLHDDKFPLPPAVYYHGFDESGHPSGSPEYIGKTVSFTDKPDGRWYRVVLDKANELAGKVWEAAKQGIARASSGSISHLARVDSNGRILEWPVAELSLFDAVGTRQPANAYAVALPVLKARTDLKALLQEADGTPATEDATEAVELSEEATNKNEVIKMAEKDEVKETPAVDMSPVLDAIKGIGESVKALNTRLDGVEKKVDKPDNDPGPAAVKSVNVIDDTTHWKYDNMDIGETALALTVLREGMRSGRSRRGASDAMVKSLAMKLDSDARKENEGYRESYMLMRNATKGMKANEIAQSTLANYGDEWVGVAYGTQLWEAIRTGTPILERQMQYAVPQPAGAETLYFPLEGADPTWYLVAQSSALSSNPGSNPTNTVTASKLGTANQSRTMAKIGARMLWTGELEEDSVVNYVAELRRQLTVSGMEMLESLIIDGDTATGATANINDIAGTPGGSEYWLGVNGYRKLALVTNTANSRDGGTLAPADFIETLKLMGVGGKNALQKDRTAFILDLHTYRKAQQLSEVITMDVNSQATVEKGDLVKMWGHSVLVSENMHAPSVGSGYELKANNAGKIDQDTASNNATGSLLAVRFDQWKPGYRRQMTIETTRFAAADATEIVALLRFGMIYRDTEASAISYNLTV